MMIIKKRAGELSTVDIAKRLHIGPLTVKKLAEQGEIKISRQVGNRTYYREDSVKNARVYNLKHKREIPGKLTSEEVGERLHYCAATIHTMARRGQLPPHERIDGRLYWAEADIAEYEARVEGMKS